MGILGFLFGRKKESVKVSNLDKKVLPSAQALKLKIRALNASEAIKELNAFLNINFASNLKDLRNENEELITIVLGLFDIVEAKVKTDKNVRENTTWQILKKKRDQLLGVINR